MAITYVASGAAANSDGTYDITPGLPAGVTNGVSYMVYFAYSREATDGSLALSPSTGWTEIVNTRTSGGILGIWGRMYQTSDSIPTLTLTNHASGDSVTARVAAWDGLVDSPIDQVGTVSTNGSQEDIGAISGITTASTYHSLVIVFGGKSDVTFFYGSVATLSGDLTWTEINENVNFNGVGLVMVWDYGIDTTGNTTIASKTFNVDDTGINAPGMGVMVSFEGTESIGGGSGGPVFRIGSSIL